MLELIGCDGVGGGGVPAIGAIERVHVSSVRLVLDQVQHRLAFGGEAGAALDCVGELGGREQTAGSVQVGVGGTQADVEHLFQVIDDDLGVDGGWRGARGPDRAIGRSGGQRSLHGHVSVYGAYSACSIGGWPRLVAGAARWSAGRRIGGTGR